MGLVYAFLDGVSQPLREQFHGLVGKRCGVEIGYPTGEDRQRAEKIAHSATIPRTAGDRGFEALTGYTATYTGPGIGSAARSTVFRCAGIVPLVP
jgi:hypothetical protein